MTSTFFTYDISTPIFYASRVFLVNIKCFYVEMKIDENEMHFRRRHAILISGKTAKQKKKKKTHLPFMRM